VPALPGDSDAVDLRSLAGWMTIALDRAGHEHAVLTNGRRHIRLDVVSGSLKQPGSAVFHYRLHGLRSAETRIFPLRRFLFLCRHRRFPAALFPDDPGIARGILALRVADALRDRASQQEIARVLFGVGAAETDLARGSDSLRSRVRRLVGEARRMAAGGYRGMMRPSERDAWRPRR
jgi:hypothetical protein